MVNKINICVLTTPNSRYWNYCMSFNQILYAFVFFSDLTFTIFVIDRRKVAYNDVYSFKNPT